MFKCIVYALVTLRQMKYAFQTGGGIMGVNLSTLLIGTDVQKKKNQFELNITFKYLTDFLFLVMVFESYTMKCLLHKRLSNKRISRFN